MHVLRNTLAPGGVCAWFLVANLWIAPVGAQPRQAPPREIQVTRTSDRIIVDGSLDEAAWRTAPLANGFEQSDPDEGEPATEDTEVRVLYDDSYLYVGVLARDREPSRIIVNELRKDFTPDTTDLFEIVLDTFHDRRNGFLFAINPAGAKWDAQSTNEGREVNANWDAVWNVRTQIAEEGWYAEVAIPFRTLKFDNRDVQSWGINFHRRLRRRNEDSFWAPIPRIYSVSRVSLAGTLAGLQGLQAGKNLRIKPYALASVARTGQAGSEGDGDVGLDVKYGVTSSLTADFTVNTDFSQVEADEQQINLTRFNLLFPEKRDFFLENSGMFQFGPATQGGAGGAGGGGRPNAVQNDLIMFFSRRIGLSDSGDAIPIAAGGRLSGRTGPFTIGALNIQQQEQDALPATNFTVVRVRRDFMANSDIGAIVLNKESDGPSYNRVAAFDANLRFFRKLDVNSFVGMSSAPSSVVGTEGSTATARTGFNYRDSFWDLRAAYLMIGERFRDEVGYVPRVGVEKVDAYIGPHFRPKAVSSWLRETFPHWQFSNVTRIGGGLESRYYDYHVPFSFQNSGFVEPGLNRSIEDLIRPFVLNARRGIVIPVGRYDFNEWFVTFRTNASAPFSASGRYGVGTFYDGYKHAYQAGLAGRANEQFNVSGTWARNVISLPTGAYTTDLISTRVNVSFSTTVFLNALLQYNTDARQWSSNVRFNIIHRPLSDIFLVVNEQRDSRSGDLLNRSIIAKMTYMVAF